MFACKTDFLYVELKARGSFIGIKPRFFVLQGSIRVCDELGKKVDAMLIICFDHIYTYLDTVRDLICFFRYLHSIDNE